MASSEYQLSFERPIFEIEARISKLEQLHHDDSNTKEAIRRMRRELAEIKKNIYADLSPWQTVEVARHPHRPMTCDYLNLVFDEFIELHGDRRFSDDPALMGGFASIKGRRVMLIGMNKGRTTAEKVANNFGMPQPEGYRKALRLMKLAEKFTLPVVCLIDTPAAYPGRGAEERGQAEAIAFNLMEMATLRTPIIVIITGEGGSGGALAIAMGDTVMMLEHSIYSVIPPEGCAAILWRDVAKAPEAAAALKIDSASLLSLGVIDKIVPEPKGGAHTNAKATFDAVRDAIISEITRLKRVGTSRLVERRMAKFGNMGQFEKLEKRPRGK
jgi:acetyl-CoA carboxylase carboxyl transferase subunit alpha